MRFQRYNGQVTNFIWSWREKNYVQTKGSRCQETTTLGLHNTNLWRNIFLLIALLVMVNQNTNNIRILYWERECCFYVFVHDTQGDGGATQAHQVRTKIRRNYRLGRIFKTDRQLRASFMDVWQYFLRTYMSKFA